MGRKPLIEGDFHENQDIKKYSIIYIMRISEPRRTGC